MDKLKYRPRLRFLSILSVIALILLALITTALARNASGILQQNSNDHFSWGAGQITDNIQESLNDYSNILYVGRGYILTNPNADTADWQNFFDSQNVFNRFPGMSSIYYAQVVTADQKNAFLAKKHSDPGIGPEYTITPNSNASPMLLPSLSIASNNVKTVGFDLYSSAFRKAVYDNAAISGTTAASGEFVMPSNDEGFFITLPVNRDSKLEGFSGVSLHSKDLFPALIKSEDLEGTAVRITDVTDPKNQTILYTTSNWTMSGDYKEGGAKLNFGDRIWKVSYRSPMTISDQLSTVVAPRLIVLAGILLVVVLMLSFYIFFRTAPPDHPKHSK